MNRGSVATAVARNKEAHPENYCAAKGCLWNTKRIPCRKHVTQSSAAHLAAEASEAVFLASPLQPEAR